MQQRGSFCQIAQLRLTAFWTSAVALATLRAQNALGRSSAHYHEERDHQGKGNLLLFPSADLSSPPESDAIECKQRLGGMLKYCHREAA